MLDRFNNLQLIGIVASIQSIRLQFENARLNVGGGQDIGATNRATALAAAEKAEALFRSIGFPNSAERARFAVQHIKARAALDFSSVCTELKTIEEAALADIAANYFIQINPDRLRFFPSKIVPMSFTRRFDFGKEVREAFPSAQEDINEAGYCLAVDANTAAVYHLICAAEHGLRALAKDRRIKFAKGPIELQQWGDIIRELDKAVAGIGNWPKSKARELAHEFYNKAVKECRFFNDAYRRHVAHARRHYDRNEALSAMNHARDFMQLLAERISEKKRTPLVWKRV